MKALLCGLILACGQSGPEPKAIDELTYGTVLYHYYQQDHQQALLATLVAEAQQRLGEDPLRFELAKGSFAFSDGMYGYARDVFAGVDSEALNELDRMRLAFHLAREYHRRGDWPALEAELARIDLGRTWFGRAKHHPEVEFMRAELAMERAEFPAALDALERLGRDHPLKAYGLFNLGVAQRAGGDLIGARRSFETLVATEGRGSEAFDLRQRARLALAIIAREQNQPADAEAVLASLPGAGRYRDIALAAYAGLAADNGDHELAARIWMTLQQQDYWTGATAAAHIGFPVSLEKLASQEQALQQYQAAEARFENRLAALTTLADQADDPLWVEGLLLAFADPEPDPRALGQQMQRWERELGHTNWLEWLATEDVQKVLTEWRELLAMNRWLEDLPGNLAAFEEITQEQQRRAALARTLLYDDELLAKRAALADRIEAAAAELASLRAAVPEPTAAWLPRLATPEQRELIGELAELEGTLDAHMSAAEQERWRPRLERLRGVLFWQLADASAVRLRELDKALAANRALLAEVDERIGRVRDAEDRFVAGVGTDFLAFADRARRLQAEVDGAIDSRGRALAAELKRGMDRERREVERYLLVTRIAIARATDRLAAVDSAAPAGADG